MPADAAARLRDANVGPEIVVHLQRIHARLAPSGGGFVVHGGPADQPEGHRCGDLITIAFEDRETAHARCVSPAGQAVLELRTGREQASRGPFAHTRERNRSASPVARRGFGSGSGGHRPPPETEKPSTDDGAAIRPRSRAMP